MKRHFVKTKNVKRFVNLMETLKKLPANVPKMGLVYGEIGLGKSQAIMKWVLLNDAVYVRANQKMTSRWLLSELCEKLGERSFWKADDNFNLIINKLSNSSKVLIIDEVDYLIYQDTIETLRDLHDRTNVPVVLVGMGAVDKKIARYKALDDRIYDRVKFEQFEFEDVKQIISELSEVVFSDEAIEYLATRTNQFRQIVKLLNKIEQKAKTNNIEQIDEYLLKEILNERILTRLSEANAVCSKNLSECSFYGVKA